MESYVSGKVTLDGNLLENGKVVFSPQGAGAIQGATGEIDGYGRYTVQTGRSGGLNAGEYIVTVVARGPSKPSQFGGPPALGKMMTPNKYRNASTSGLVFEVDSGSNKIDLALISE